MSGGGARARTIAALAIVVTSASASLAVACGSAYSAAMEPTDTSIDGAALADAAAASPDAATSTDATSCGADLIVDPKNCGRCGHDCLGGECAGGTCKAFEMSAVSAPLVYVALHGAYVYVSSYNSRFDQDGGIWRAPTSGGALERVVSLHSAEAFAFLGDTLYFVVWDAAADDVTTFGGLYSCTVATPPPCTPTRIAAAENPQALHVDSHGRIFYADTPMVGQRLMLYAPPAAPVPYRELDARARDVYVDDEGAFFSDTILTVPRQARAAELDADGGYATRYSFSDPNANMGRMLGSPTELLFTAYTYQATATGVVRRIPRNGGAGCDYGGSSNARPYGIFSDSDFVYWTNQGVGANVPYVDGSVARCPKNGCCTKPEVLWNGNSPTGVTADATAIYFVTNAGSVWKIAK